jgi:hypothetical protein
MLTAIAVTVAGQLGPVVGLHPSHGQLFLLFWVAIALLAIGVLLIFYPMALWPAWRWAKQQVNLAGTSLPASITSEQRTPIHVFITCGVEQGFVYLTVTNETESTAKFKAEIIRLKGANRNVVLPIPVKWRDSEMDEQAISSHYSRVLELALGDGMGELLAEPDNARDSAAKIRLISPADQHVVQIPYERLTHIYERSLDITIRVYSEERQGSVTRTIRMGFENKADPQQKTHRGLTNLQVRAEILEDHIGWSEPDEDGMDTSIMCDLATTGNPVRVVYHPVMWLKDIHQMWVNGNRITTTDIKERTPHATVDVAGGTLTVSDWEYDRCRLILDESNTNGAKVTMRLLLKKRIRL